MIIEKKLLSDLIPSPYNPRQSTKKQEGHLQDSLTKFDVVEPPIWNKRSGYIVGGHFRIRELIKLGYKEVECVIVDLNEEDEIELNIRLNANTGSFDFDILANWGKEAELKSWGLDVWEHEQTDTVKNLHDENYIKISIEATNNAFIEMNEKLQNICDEYSAIMKVK